MSTPTVQLVQITDPHLFADPAGRLRGVPTLLALKDTLRAAEADIRAADAILATGDLVQDDVGGYAPFRQVMGRLGKPVLCIPGNHDDAVELERALRGPPFQVGGHYDTAGWRVVLLDSSVPRQTRGSLSPSELDRLERALAGAPDRHALVALHHQPIRMGSQWLDTVGLTNPDALFAILDRHPQVRGVVFGHVHQAYEGERHGVRILGTPSTCAQFLPRSPDFAVDTLPPAYRVLRLLPEGTVQSHIAWLPDEQRAAGGRR